MPLTPLDLERVRAEYRQGRSLREVAQEVGVSHVHLWRLLKASGEPIRSNVPSAEQMQNLRKGKKELAALQAAHAVVLYTAGVPVEEIAYSMRHRVDWVREKLKDAGIDPRVKP